MSTSSRLVRWSVTAGGLAFVALFVFFIIHRAVPGVIGGGQRAAQSAAVSQLRTLLWAQDHLASLKAADRDGDGRGEYGFLAHLSKKASIPTATPLPAPLLQGALAELHPGARGGVTEHGGYVFAIYLPARAGGAALELPNGGEQDGAVDPDGAERYWIAYAWPLERGKSGHKVFFINQDEEIWESTGAAPGQGYSGSIRAPAFDAALPRPDFSTAPVEGGPAGDGGVWVRWKGKKGRKS